MLIYDIRCSKRAEILECSHLLQCRLDWVSPHDLHQCATLLLFFMQRRKGTQTGRLCRGRILLTFAHRPREREVKIRKGSPNGIDGQDGDSVGLLRPQESEVGLVPHVLHPRAVVGGLMLHHIAPHTAQRVDFHQGLPETRARVSARPQRSAQGSHYAFPTGAQGPGQAGWGGHWLPEGSG